MARIRTIKPADGAVYLYCITEHSDIETGPCKIGITARPDKRLSSLQGGNWRPICYVWMLTLPSKDLALSVEKHCLSLFRPSQYKTVEDIQLQSEWVNAAPNKVIAAAISLISANDVPILRAV
jgi:hypothetical protein